MPVGDAALSRGDLMRRVADLERRVQQLFAARRLEAATIGAGGVRVLPGAGVTVESVGGGYVKLTDGEIYLIGDDAASDLPGRIVAQVQGEDLRGALWLLPPRPPGTADLDHVIYVTANVGDGNGQVYLASIGYAWLRGTVSTTVDGDNLLVLRSTNGAAQLIGQTAFVEGDGGVFVSADNGQLQLDSGIGQAYLLNHATTSNAPSMVIEANGFLARSTSSLRYKTDVEDHDIDIGAVLALQPRSWRDRAEVEHDPETTNRHVGFVAEDLDTLGLTEFVTYDAEGRPDAIEYDRLTTALVAVIQLQQRQIDALTKRVDALDGQKTPKAVSRRARKASPIRRTPPRHRPEPTPRTTPTAEPPRFGKPKIPDPDLGATP